MQIINEDVINIYNRCHDIFNESRKEAKQLIASGKLSQEEFDTIVSIDPTEQKKYTGWLARVYTSGQEKNIDTLRNTIEEFDVFVRRNLLKDQKSNIQSYKTFEDLFNTVDELNKTETTSSKGQLSGDFDVIVDNEDIRIVIPYTHEASRKLGLTPIEQGGFAFRDCGGNKKDSAWCTTYSTSSHFDDYYYNKYVDFFYTLIKSERLKNILYSNGFGPEHTVMALARISLNNYENENEDIIDSALVRKNSEGNTVAYDAYDGTDTQINKNALERWMSIVGIK